MTVIAEAITELRWLITVDGAPAAHHTLHISGDVPIALPHPLPRWGVASDPWARDLDWTVEVRPRVLRAHDAWAVALGVTEGAAALVVREHGTAGPGTVVDHELVVLVEHAELAAPAWRPRLAAVHALRPAA